MSSKEHLELLDPLLKLVPLSCLPAMEQISPTGRGSQFSFCMTVTVACGTYYNLF